MKNPCKDPSLLRRQRNLRLISAAMGRQGRHLASLITLATLLAQRFAARVWIQHVHRHHFWRPPAGLHSASFFPSCAKKSWLMNPVGLKETCLLYSSDPHGPEVDHHSMFEPQDLAVVNWLTVLQSSQRAGSCRQSLSSGGLIHA